MSITSETLRPDLQLFPAGTSVGAYLPSAWSRALISGAPTGSAVATASVQTDGTLTFTGLAEFTEYIGYASVGGADRIFRFSTRNSTGPAHIGGAIVVPDCFEVPFSTTAVAAVGSTDAATYNQVCVHIVTQGTSSTVNFQGSNDGTNWVAVPLASIAATGTSAPATSSASAGTIFSGPLPYRYFRLNVTGISAGTTAGVIEFKAAAAAPISGLNVNSQTPTPTASAVNSAATTNSTSIKATAATLYGLVAYNAGALPAYVKIYNKASGPSVGTDVPVAVIAVPATSSVSLECGALGLRLGTGYAIAITGGAADTDTTAVAAAQVKVFSAYV